MSSNSGLSFKPIASSLRASTSSVAFLKYLFFVSSLIASPIGFSCLAFCSIAIVPLVFAGFFSPSNKLNLGPFKLSKHASNSVMLPYFGFKVFFAMPLWTAGKFYCEGFEFIRNAPMTELNLKMDKENFTNF
ncbi:hypothetical protein L596_028748 [Steinernema carpocapsae]|nr:hypothetical protein L596_028748 [Steinernema carpocapsae]